MRTDRGWTASPIAIFAVSLAVALIVSQLAELALPATPRAVSALLAGLALAGAVSLGWWHRGVLPLRRAEERSDALLRAVPDPLMLLDRDGVVLAANPAALQRFGDNGRLVGQPLFGRQPSEEGRAALAQLRDAARAHRPAAFAADWDGAQLQVRAEPAQAEQVPAGGVLIVHVVDGSDTVRAAALAAVCRDLDSGHPADTEAAVEILTTACRRLVEALGLRLAWVARPETGGLAVLACAGREIDADGEVRRNPARWDDPAGRGPIAAALRGGGPQVAAVGEASVQEWQKSARRFGIRTVCAVPVPAGDAVLAALVLASRRSEGFDDPLLVAGLQAVAARIGAVLSAAAERERLARREAALDAVAEAVFLTDRAGAIEWSNAGFSRLTGYARDEVIGRNPRLLGSERQDAEFWRDMWATIQAGGTWSGELVDRRKDGSEYVARQTVTPLRDGSGAVSRFLAVQEDVSGLRALEEQMRHMAQYDALTELPNRALFLDRLDHNLAVARRNHHALALLTLNLDHFRMVNDTFGLAAGDLLLQAIATRLRQAVRVSDTVARVGGDEFAVIAPQVLVREDAARVAQKLFEALKTPCDVEGREIKVTASIGIAMYPQDGESAEQLVARSSGALRVMKMQDRNGYRFATPA